MRRSGRGPQDSAREFRTVPLVRNARLSPARLADHLALETAETRRLVRRLRRMVLAAAPTAAEGIRFNCLCYYDVAAPFGAIGGNICMIEARQGKVSLSFLHGAEMHDPHRLLSGKGKAKRRVPVEANDADDPRLRALVLEAAACANRRAAGGESLGNRICRPNAGGASPRRRGHSFHD